MSGRCGGSPNRRVAKASLRAARRASWLERLRLDLGRTIEVRGPVIWYLIVERGLKGLALVAAAIFIYTHTETGFGPVVSGLIDTFSLDVGSGFIHRVIVENLLRLAGMSERALWVVGTGSLVYGLIEAGESVGLLLRRRWAEYLVVIATAFFIPFEMLEVVRRPTILRALALVANIVVVIYLVRKKRLFILDESPGDA
jgi:uncharacterized membrane protein (DUF2068 family)